MLLHSFPYLTMIFTMAQSARILVISQLWSKSHHISLIPIVETLADRNHDVTFLTYFPHKHSNVKTLRLKLPESIVYGDEDLKDFILKSNKHGPVTQMMDYEAFAELACDNLLQDEATRSVVLNGAQFEVVIVDGMHGSCAGAATSSIRKHLIYYYTSGWPLEWMDNAVPNPHSYVPNALEHLPSQMNFWQRLQNLLTFLGVAAIHKYAINPAMQRAVHKYFPDAPNINEVQGMVDFTLVNGDSVTVSPRPSMPNIVYIGGMHCRPSIPLPKELNDFVEDAGEDGFIVFGLGSIIKAGCLSPEFRSSVISAFSRLKQKVIWKLEEQLENLPKNVKIVEWMPQQDLLGHPKARLFITHSGLLSMQEAIYHGVPVIGMPFFADQKGNIARLKDLGIGEVLDFTNGTADSFYQAINQILNDKRYYENMKKYSAIFRDQPQKSIATAVYWIEYVMRHDGAHHFRSAAENLNFFQYFLLDVVAFVGLVLISIFVLVAYSLRFLLRIIFEDKQTKDKITKKIK